MHPNQMTPTQIAAARYKPPGAWLIQHKEADACAYCATSPRGVHVVAYRGRAIRPAGNYLFKTAASAERYVTRFFDSVFQSEALRAEQKAKRNARTHKLQVGHILRSSWGYDQTNVDWYQVTRVISDKMVEIRKIAHAARDSAEGYSPMSGTTWPAIDEFVSEPARARAAGDGVTIPSAIGYGKTAYLWNGKAAYESWYA